MSRQRPQKEMVRCKELQGEKFYADKNNIFRYHWWEVFCFPYILCARIWDCCMSLGTGTNQCLLYWMALQWVLCKITRMTTPDPILFPYFFYLFCQVLLLTLFFVVLWLWIGKKHILPYFVTIYKSLSSDVILEKAVTEAAKGSSGRRGTVFRKYCFKKSELFDVPHDGGSFMTPRADLVLAMILILVLGTLINKKF